ncbi:MAG: cyclic nucleotide-binding domain-containing protein [Actinomycetota bacterium]
MSHLLDHVGDRPVRHFGDGEVLIAEGETDTPLFVLSDGRLLVERDGQRIAMVDQPGAVLGEISMLLGVPATASVRAVEGASVHVVDAADAGIIDDAAVMGDVARLLAARLQAMVTYLVDVKQQYADASGHLGLVDDVLGQLTFGVAGDVESGSERDPEPYY